MSSDQVTPAFVHSVENGTVIAIEASHLRVSADGIEIFPAWWASEMLFLVLRNTEKDWKMPPTAWKLAANPI